MYFIVNLFSEIYVNIQRIVLGNLLLYFNRDKQ